MRFFEWLKIRKRERTRRDLAEKFFIAAISQGGQVMKHAAMAARAVRNADALMSALEAENLTDE